MEWLIHPRDAGDVEIYMDAATTTGMGGFESMEEGRCFEVLWKDLKICETKPDILYLERLGVVAAAKLFGKE